MITKCGLVIPYKFNILNKKSISIITYDLNGNNGFSVNNNLLDYSFLPTLTVIDIKSSKIGKRYVYVKEIYKWITYNSISHHVNSNNMELVT